MSRTLAALALLLLVPASLQAALPDEHPEWFTWTAQPPQSFASARLQPAARAFANPEIGATWLTVLDFVAQQGLDTVLIYPDQQQREYLTEWMTTNGLFPDTFTWMQVATDTRYTGEWSPQPLKDAEGHLLPMDAAYYQGRPEDDAFAGRWAELVSAPLLRAPLFLANCQWAITADGLCLVSEKVASTATKLNAAQLRHVLRAWYGCREVLLLPGPPADGLGCLDAFLRPLPSGDILLARPDSVGLKPTVATYRKALTAILPAGRKLLEVDVPPPKVVSSSVWVYLSYLYFVEGPSALLLPAYTNYDAGLAQLKDFLADEFPGKAQVVVNCDALADLRLWPSKMLGTLPAGDFADLTPTPLCASLDPATCGLCLDECFEGETLCADELTNQTCEMGGGEGACRVFQTLPCGNDEVCADGACKDKHSPCDGVPAGGMCEGEKVKNCVGSTVIYEDCGAKGTFCADDGVKAHCTAACVHKCPEEGVTSCGEDGSVLTCELGQTGCRELTAATCPEEQTCQDGACHGTADVTNGDARDETVVQADDPPTFRKSGGSCNTSPAAPTNPWWLLLAVVLVLRARLGRVVSNKT